MKRKETNDILKREEKRRYRRKRGTAFIPVHT